MHEMSFLKNRRKNFLKKLTTRWQTVVSWTCDVHAIPSRIKIPKKFLKNQRIQIFFMYWIFKKSASKIVKPIIFSLKIRFKNIKPTICLLYEWRSNSTHSVGLDFVPHLLSVRVAVGEVTRQNPPEWIVDRMRL